MSIKPFSASLYAGTVASVGVLEDISLRALGRRDGRLSEQGV